MYRLTITNVEDSWIKELIYLFTADIRWAFDPTTKTITADGDLDVILKVMIYLATRFSLFSAMGFTVVRLAEQEKDKKEEWNADTKVE